MIVECPGCTRKIRVGLAYAGDYYEETAGLADLAGTCPRTRINGACCEALIKLTAMRANHPTLAEEEAA